jgi:SAM-dependent methyltransferase
VELTGQPGDPTVLLSPAGAEILARVAAARSGAGGADVGGGAGGAGSGGGSGGGALRSELALAAELRREYPAELAAAAMAQHELRMAARAKFSRAMDMLFTRGGYEQASPEVLARHQAARFGGARRIADLCCGIGGDLIALASAPEREVLGVDRDPVHAALALYNAGVYGVGDRVRTCVADVRDVDVGGFDAVFIDPARRADVRGGQATPGRFRAGMSEPPLSWCLALADRVAAVGIKAAPGLPAELIPPGWEAEFIADGRDLKEAVLWSPALAAAARPAAGPVPGTGPAAGPVPGTGPAARPRRATILPAGHTLVAVPGDPVPVSVPGEYLLDPNPAVTRAGLVEDLARTIGAWKIDDQIAFLTVNHEVLTPFARTLRVVYSAPWNEKRFAARLRELGVGAADLRRRGLAGDVDQIRRRLKLAGPHRATIVLTRVDDKPWGLICADPGTPLAAQS